MSTTSRRESSRESWSSACEVNPSLAAEIGREEDGNAAAENARPWTAAGAVKSSVSTPLGTRPNHPPPPAGMMTVTVRRGSEETSVVTPIVLTESGGEDADATTTPSSISVSAGGGLLLMAGSGSLGGDDGRSGRGVRPSAVPLAETADSTIAKGTSAVDGGGADTPEAYAAGPVARGEAKVGRGEVIAVAVERRTALANTEAALLSVPKTRLVETTTEGQGSPLPNNGTSTLQPATQVAAAATSARVANVTPSERSGEEGARTVVKSTEQLFMEDTQVYLGCMVCGVKYLVEAVEPGPEKSSKCDAWAVLRLIF